MSLPAFQTTVVNGTGDILTAATVTVTVEATGAAAVLFSDRNGTIGLGSGGVFSVNGTTAFAQFFAAPGEYRIEANDAVSGFSETWRYQVLSGTASLVNTGTSASNVPLNSDLGTASLVDKQTSSTDTTADALMVVGAFGLGSDLNLNSTVHATGTPNDIAGTGMVVGGADAFTLGISGFVSGTLGTLTTYATGATTSELRKYSRSWTNGSASYIQLAGSGGTTWSAWQPVYTGANYQPDTVNGIGVVRLMRNVSGGTIANGGTVDGALLKQAYFQSNGVIADNGSGGSGNDWRNVSGLGSADDTFVYMSRFA
jgi:hypothetical protein